MAMVKLLLEEIAMKERMLEVELREEKLVQKFMAWVAMGMMIILLYFYLLH